MAIRIKNGALLLNKDGTGLRESCPSSCIVKLTRYTYSPCDADAGGVHDYHRGLSLVPWACGSIGTNNYERLGWHSITESGSSISGVSWNYTQDSTVINVIKSKSVVRHSAGNAQIELYGSNAEYGEVSCSGGIWFQNKPCCHESCSTKNAWGHFYYEVKVEGTCGTALVWSWYESTGTPYEFNRNTGQLEFRGGSQSYLRLSPEYTFTSGTHSLDLYWTSIYGSMGDGPGIVVLFVG